MESTPLGAEVRRARAAKGLSLQALSDRTAHFNGGDKLPVRTIHGIETGETRYPTERVLRPLSTALEPETSFKKLALLVYGLVAV